jgi:uncharacterized damage-inducible protein DinB
MTQRYEQFAEWNNAMTEFVMVYRAIPAEKRDQPINGGWSARQLVEHLLETEILFSTRMRAALAAPGSAIAAWDPDAYIAQVPNSAVPDELLLDALAALRSVNLTILRALPEETWAQTVQHPEAGTQSLERIVNIFGNHVTEHLNDMKQAGLSARTL